MTYKNDLTELVSTQFKVFLQHTENDPANNQLITDMHLDNQLCAHFKTLMLCCLVLCFETNQVILKFAGSSVKVCLALHRPCQHVVILVSQMVYLAAHQRE